MRGRAGTHRRCQRGLTFRGVTHRQKCTSTVLPAGTYLPRKGPPAAENTTTRTRIHACVRACVRAFSGCLAARGTDMGVLMGK